MNPKPKNVGFTKNQVKIQHVTARDPRTGMKATGLTRGGAIAKLQGMTGGKRIPNPIIKRT